MFVERRELRPPTRDGNGIPQTTVALGVVEQALEGQCQPTAKAGALRFEPEPQCHLDAIVGVGEKVTLPSCYGFAVATRFDVALEELGVHSHVAEVELHEVMRDAQTVADESMELEQGLAQ
jgi:hypothetical protein